MTFSPLLHFASLEEALASLFGADIKIAQTDRIAGGDINKAYCLTLTDKTRIFMKSNTKENESFFTAEAAGLAAIAGTKTIRTPHIFCTGRDENGHGSSFLLMEFISAKKRAPDYWETFARQLVAMHQASTADFVPEGRYGFVQENYIGSHSQINSVHDSWISFFRDCRLEPQFQHASRYFDREDLKKISRLLDRVEDILIEPEHPSLLHGDLWSGNVITGNDGMAWLIDPAAYVGHAEADLAMTELFGGFPQTFYRAYHEAAPLQSGYDRRRNLYNLYHLLNHLNIFGQMYLLSVKRTVEEYI